MERISSSPYSDNRLLINEGELSLQRLAAIVVAIEVLPYDLKCCRTTAENLGELYCVQWWLEPHGWNVIKKLLAPEPIQKLISKPIELIASEIDMWLRHHIPHVFEEWCCKRDDFVLKFIRHFVWTSCGTIDYVRTAEKWIADADLELSSEQKYRLACLNCLVDTIGNLYRENLIMANAETTLPLVYYWTSKMKIKDFVVNEIVNSAPPYVPTWAYLLEQMNEEERYSFSVGRMLEQVMEFPSRVVKDLLPKFTAIEQRRLFGEKLPELMRLFVIDYHPQFAIQLWSYASNAISAKIYYDVLEEFRGIGVYFGDDPTPDWLADLGMEMWRCAPDSLKESMFHHRNGDFICEWVEWFSFDMNRDEMFLLEMLSDVNPEYRKSFLLARWDDLLYDCESEYFSKVIEVCLPNPCDMDEFFEELANSSRLLEHLKTLCNDLKFSEFTEFLDRFVRNTKLKGELKKRFIPSDDKRIKLGTSQSTSKKDIEALSVLLTEVHGFEISVGYKANFIRSEFIRCISDRELWSIYLIQSLPLERKPMGLAKHQKVVYDAEYLCDEQQLKLVKQKLLVDREYFETLAKEKKNMVVWDDLLKWLIGGRQAMLDDSSLLERYRSRSPITRT